jgi:hypothetical protein
MTTSAMTALSVVETACEIEPSMVGGAREVRFQRGPRTERAQAACRHQDSPFHECCYNIVRFTALDRDAVAFMLRPSPPAVSRWRYEASSILAAACGECGRPFQRWRRFSESQSVPDG